MHSECVFVDLVIQHAKRLRSIILPSVACLDLPYFPTLSHKRQEVGKTLLNIKCVLIFSTTLVSKFLILKRIQLFIIINVCRSSSKETVIPVGFNESSVF